MSVRLVLYPGGFLHATVEGNFDFEASRELLIEARKLWQTGACEMFLSLHHVVHANACAIGTIALLVLGVILVNPQIEAPMFSQWIHGGGPIIDPGRVAGRHHAAPRAGRGGPRAALTLRGPRPEARARLPRVRPRGGHPGRARRRPALPALRREARPRPRRVREVLVVAHRVRGEAVEVRRAALAVAVAGEMIGAERVHDDDDHVAGLRRRGRDPSRGVFDDRGPRLREPDEPARDERGRDHRDERARLGRQRLAQVGDRQRRQRCQRRYDQ